MNGENGPDEAAQPNTTSPARTAGNLREQHEKQHRSETVEKHIH